MVRHKNELTPGKPPKIAGYVRVSTPMQVERGESLDVQEQRLRAEAKRRGWKLVLYCEPGISAKDENRPEYGRMWKDLEAGRVDGVVTTKLDRLWRSSRNALNAIYELCQVWGRSLIFLDQPVDTTKPEGRAMFNIMLTFAEFERDMTSIRVGETMRARAQKGKYNGGPIPYGYQLVEKGKPEVLPAEAETVREIFDLFLQKGTVRGVTLALNAAGKRTRMGDLWTNQTIRRILSSLTYVGDLVYNKLDTTSGKAKSRPESEHIRVAAAVPAIVDRETFEAVQRLRAAKPVLAPRSQVSDFLLAGLVRCEACGGNMAGHSMWGRGKKRRHRYYRCYRLTQKGPTACSGRAAVRADLLENAVVSYLFDLRVNPDRLRALLSTEWDDRRNAIPGLRRKVARLERDVAEIARREDQIMLAFEKGAYSVDDMAARRARAGADRAEVETALAKAQAEVAGIMVDTPDVEFIVRCLEHGWDIFMHSDFDNRRCLLHGLIDRVVVEDRNGGYFIFKDFGQEWGELLEFYEGGAPRKQAFEFYRCDDPVIKAWARKEVKRVLSARASNRDRTVARADI